MAEPIGTPQAPLFSRVDHVGIAVPDLTEAIAFYGDMFGVHSVHEEVNEEELLAPLNEASTIAKFIDRSGPGLQQVAFAVDDLDAVTATLRDRGVRLLYDAPRRGTADSRVNFVHPRDTGGVLIELVQPAAAH